MLRGFVFKSQTFTDEAFAHFINTFLDKKMGITKGCTVTNTTNSVSIATGYFCIYGRMLQIQGTETIEDITNTGYYQLVCEIDLSKTNTETELNQASIKLVKGTTGYSQLTQEDLDNGGNIYQFEFARFKVTDTGITDFSETGAKLSFQGIYDAVDTKTTALIDQIKAELEDVEKETVFLLKNQIQVGTEIPTELDDNTVYIQVVE